MLRMGMGGGASAVISGPALAEISPDQQAGINDIAGSLPLQVGNPSNIVGAVAGDIVMPASGKFRNVSGAGTVSLAPASSLYRRAAPLTRNVNSEASLATYILPAGRLAADGDSLVIRMAGHDTGAAGAGLPSSAYFQLRFGAGWFPFNIPYGNFAGTENMPAVAFGSEWVITRRSAVTQHVSMNGWTDSAAFAVGSYLASFGGRSTAAGENLANAVTLDFRARPSFRTAVGTITLDQIDVMFVGA